MDKKHKATIQTNYAKAKCFEETKGFIFDLYERIESENFLSKVNYIFITEICNYLGIKTKISLSTDYNLIEGKTERLVDLCLQTKATHYLSGPAAKEYLDEKLFDERNIAVEWMDYGGYKEYTQLHPPFEHGVTILDLIFNEGENSRKFLKF